MKASSLQQPLTRRERNGGTKPARDYVKQEISRAEELWLAAKNGATLSQCKRVKVRLCNKHSAESYETRSQHAKRS